MTETAPGRGEKPRPGKRKPTSMAHEWPDQRRWAKTVSDQDERWMLSALTLAGQSRARLLKRLRELDPEQDWQATVIFAPNGRVGLLATLIETVTLALNDDPLFRAIPAMGKMQIRGYMAQLKRMIYEVTAKLS